MESQQLVRVSNKGMEHYPNLLFTFMNYTCLKNVTTLPRYNFDKHEPNFGRAITEKARNQNVPYFPTSPN